VKASHNDILSFSNFAFYQQTHLKHHYVGYIFKTHLKHRLWWLYILKGKMTNQMSEFGISSMIFVYSLCK